VHFDDLEPCTFHSGHLDADAWAVPLRAVGWLEHPYPFATGEAPVGLVGKLMTLADQTRSAFSQYQFRGVHECSVCIVEGLGRSGGGVGWSQENLIIPGNGEIYAAPGGVAHYVKDHHYLPPSAFIAAVMECPDCSSDEYLQTLVRANNGKAIPLERFEDLLRRERARRERAG
jgi:hypothetical protein